VTVRPFIVPVFIPHAGCPHRCVFCNQTAITGRPAGQADSGDWRTRAREFLRFQRKPGGIVQIAFFGGNLLGLAAGHIRRLLAEASDFVRAGEVQGVRFSTRPDTVNRQTLDLLKHFPVQTVELGAQSMDDDVLRRSGRGHTAADTSAAVDRLKDRGYEVGLQMMVGLPGDDGARLMETGRRIAAFKPDFVRIYPTLVLAGSLLETWYHEGRYRPLSVDEAVQQTMLLYRLFRQQGIPVIRTGLQPTEEITAGSAVVAGPFHPAFGHLVQSACFVDALSNALRRMAISHQTLEIWVHPKSLARMRGLRNANCGTLRREFGFLDVNVRPDSELAEDAIGLPDGRVVSAYAPRKCLVPEIISIA
jgi:histone acetyltransferase (RNA polymerase elongator complex component)